MNPNCNPLSRNPGRRFLTVPMAVTAAMILIAGVTTAQAVTFNYTDFVRTINPDQHGQTFWSYPNAETGIDAQSDNQVPYPFHAGTFMRGPMPAQQDFQWKTGTRFEETSTMLFLKVARDLGGHPMINVNMQGYKAFPDGGFTDAGDDELARQAGDWVWYVNYMLSHYRINASNQITDVNGNPVTLSAREQAILDNISWQKEPKLLPLGSASPPPVTYWEIGNEIEFCDPSSNPDPAKTAILDSTGYPRRYKAITQAMLDNATASNVPIKVGISISGNGVFKFPGTNMNYRGAYRDLNCHIDFVAYHPYDWALCDGGWIRGTLSSVGTNQETLLTAVKNTLTADGRNVAGIEFIASEWDVEGGARSRRTNPPPPEEQKKIWTPAEDDNLQGTMYVALGTAEAIFRMANQGVRAGNWFRNAVSIIDGKTEYPVGKLFYLFNAYYGDSLVSVNNGTPVQMYATRAGGSNGWLALWCLNFDPTNSSNVQVTINNLPSTFTRCDRIRLRKPGSTPSYYDNNTAGQDVVGFLYDNSLYTGNPLTFNNRPLSLDAGTITVYLFYNGNDTTAPSTVTVTARSYTDNSTQHQRYIRLGWTSASDTESGLDNYTYSVDGGAETSVGLSNTALLSLGNLSYGSHTACVRAYNNAGGVSTSASVTFWNDITAPSSPVVTAPSSPSNHVYKGDNLTVQWNASTETESVLDHYEWALDNSNGNYSSVSLCTSVQIPTAALTVGGHTVYVRAVNSVGLISAPASAGFTILTPPTVRGNFDNQMGINFFWAINGTSSGPFNPYVVKAHLVTDPATGYINGFASNWKYGWFAYIAPSSGADDHIRALDVGGYLGTDQAQLLIARGLSAPAHTNIYAVTAAGFPAYDVLNPAFTADPGRDVTGLALTQSSGADAVDLLLGETTWQNLWQYRYTATAFLSQKACATAAYPGDMATFRYNGQNYLAMILNYAPNNIYIYRVDSAGGLTWAYSITSAYTFTRLAVGDLDNDGVANDLIALNQDWYNAFWYKLTDSGSSFVSNWLLYAAAGSHFAAVKIGDPVGDGINRLIYGVNDWSGATPGIIFYRYSYSGGTGSLSIEYALWVGGSTQTQVGGFAFDKPAIANAAPNGTMESWTGSLPSGWTGFNAASSTVSHSGNSSCNITGVGMNACVWSQGSSLNLIPGVAYRLSGWINSDYSPGCVGEIWICDGSGYPTLLRSGTGSGWKYVEREFIASGNEQTIGCENLDGCQSILYDDIRLVPITTATYNGSMEYWDTPDNPTLVNGWGSRSSPDTPTVSTAIKHGGNRSAQLTGTNYLARNISSCLTKGQVYRLSGWIYTAAGNANQSGAIALATPEYAYSPSPWLGLDTSSRNVWKYVEMEFTSDGTETYLFCYNGFLGASGVCYYDDVNIEPLNQKELLTNGSMESWTNSTLDNWQICCTCRQGTSDNRTMGRSSAEIKQGNSSGDRYIYQPISLTAGRSYRLSGWILRRDGLSSQYGYIRIVKSVGDSLALAGSNENGKWQYVQKDFVADGHEIYLDCYNGIDGTSACWFDGVSLRDLSPSN